MPEAAALPAIASGLPPLDLLAYQIHMPSPSNGEPGGVVAGSGALIGAGTIGGGSCLAAAGAGRISAAATAAGSAKRRTLRFLALSPVSLLTRPAYPRVRFGSRSG